MSLKLIKVVYTYTDRHGRFWSVYKESLPKKKGEFIFWVGECDTASHSVRSDSKKGVLKEIKALLIPKHDDYKPHRSIR